MKYLIRAVKYFFYFAILTSAIIFALVFIGAVEGDINSIFEDGYESIWKIAVFFTAVAAVYPKLAFINRNIATERDWQDIRQIVSEYMNDRRYVLESENAGSLTFRCRGIASRLSKMYEDRVTVTRTESGLVIEGLRKDVLSLSNGIEYRLNNTEAI